VFHFSPSFSDDLARSCLVSLDLWGGAGGGTLKIFFRYFSIIAYGDDRDPLRYKLASLHCQGETLLGNTAGPGTRGSHMSTCRLLAFLESTSEAINAPVY
jgi:hypothetical protein